MKSKRWFNILIVAIIIIMIGLAVWFGLWLYDREIARANYIEVAKLADATIEYIDTFELEQSGYIDSTNLSVSTKESPEIKIIYIEVPVEVIKEVPIYVTQNVTVEKIVYAPLSDFESVEALKAFLVVDDTNSHIFLKANKDGVVNLVGVCEEFAFQLRERAELIGKRLDTEILTKQECFKYEGYIESGASRLDVNDGHYICKAVIENEVWFIEPQNDRIWLAYYLD